MRKTGTSEYLQREEAAKKQLGKKGVQKRVNQVPRAARAVAGVLTGGAANKLQKLKNSKKAK
jgi:hypothetical protein